MPLRLALLVACLCSVVAAHPPQHHSAVLELSHLQLDHIVSTATKPLLLQFYSPTCIHCVRFAPAYEQLASDLTSDAFVARVDGINHRALRLRFHVMAFPSFFLIHAGSVFEFVGSASSEQLLNFVRSHGAISGKKLSSLAGPLSPYWKLVHLLFRFVYFLQRHVHMYQRNGGNMAFLVLAVVIGVLSAFVVIIHLITRPPKPYPQRTRLHHD
ncbi:Protein disulfide-isomerase tigA [Gracilariopsis chorda]|uniref:Protein disulfide-isomerase tigA n=1 Tax=Gracilariopsis chorda TaxID=448386 RepID=A0A2V3ILF4_9FLOR|nr:Protein disulfide-isomerase tigA [Gracilariopsis chorda]|eukprot:PXF42922.1 Protein disulfide-isomerase tigA [Gracilariopsis chorda]